MSDLEDGNKDEVFNYFINVIFFTDFITGNFLLHALHFV